MTMSGDSVIHKRVVDLPPTSELEPNTIYYVDRDDLVVMYVVGMDGQPKMVAPRQEMIWNTAVEAALETPPDNPEDISKFVNALDKGLNYE